MTWNCFFLGFCAGAIATLALVMAVTWIMDKIPELTIVIHDGQFKIERRE